MLGMTGNQRFASYLRVSTGRQQVSGLGLEAQREAVRQFTRQTNGELLAEFVEAESGKKNEREVLHEALAFCKKHRATLLLAKLDRLSRKVHFISGLMEVKGLDFLSIEHPTRDRFWLHLQAAFAEEEGRRISQRTKAALAAMKVGPRGHLLGATGRVLAKRHKAEATKKAFTYESAVNELRSEGIKTVKATMDALNERGILSPGGKRWHLRSTWKLLNRLKTAACPEKQQPG
jgi:DNA invertase Pin-like site-specific DNA recombinase